MATETPTDPQKGVQLLAQLMAQLMRQINEFLAERANEREATRQQLRDLQERITSLQATLGVTPQGSTSSANTSPLLVSVSPPSTSSQTKKVKATLPDPEKFDGTLWKFPAWLLEMQNKLRTDGTVFGCPKAQFAYIFSRLDHNPKALATSFAREGGQGGTFEPDAFLAYLSFCYGNPNNKRMALARLRYLKQGERESFATFFPKFEKELADSGANRLSTTISESGNEEPASHPT
ncbi:hypothetical protein C7999DRAFT_32596 [Corynascus novoguineensis]|uniref:Retrotransposon gag domain-containing protein n=1 Tax=Corynascus novoguineensis TaxID=1126955 RepID=A0AAN7CSE9_9PEZI|nr:hypothetical protein C7999DRAFT_32596 [Corynascus novoguineensis]